LHATPYRFGLLTKEVSLAQLSPVSAAIQKQISRDFDPMWNVEAAVDAFGKLEDAPLGNSRRRKCIADFGQLDFSRNARRKSFSIHEPKSLLGLVSHGQRAPK
jgi:hypothetical protein